MGDLQATARLLCERDEPGAEILSKVFAQTLSSRHPFYGRIVISFASGIITCIAKEENFKPTPAATRK